MPKKLYMERYTLNYIVWKLDIPCGKLKISSALRILKVFCLDKTPLMDESTYSIE